jgi:serine/threonine-protein kinase
MRLKAGEQVSHYTVLSKLGQGGMSEVYLARDEANGREVVLKFPNDDSMSDPASYERFTREVKIGEILTHPNIQKLYEVCTEKPNTYLVLEYVDGASLRDIINREAPFTLEKAVSLGSQIAQALGYAHANHIYHRDLKPENIIVTAEGKAKVMDFGIAFVEGARRVTWGRLSAQVGTPDYMAPEQIKGKRGDARTDIYSLGIMVYEFFAARPPYEGDNALSIMNQHVTNNPPPLHRFNKKVSPAIEEIVLKATRRDPEERWETMESFADALQNPEKIDVEVLKAERQKKEKTSRNLATPENPLGLPLWQVALITIVILLGIIAFGVIAQLLHH